MREESDKLKPHGKEAAALGGNKKSTLDDFISIQELVAERLVRSNKQDSHIATDMEG
jgi:hypothetical protein